MKIHDLVARLGTYYISSMFFNSSSLLFHLHTTYTRTYHCRSSINDFHILYQNFITKIALQRFVICYPRRIECHFMNAFMFSNFIAAHFCPAESEREFVNSNSRTEKRPSVKALEVMKNKTKRVAQFWRRIKRRRTFCRLRVD